jgi:hypothetical protein
MDIRHCLLSQARCGGCGGGLQADIPSAHAPGYGPRLPARMGALGGMHRPARRLVQDVCHSVFPIPLSLGTIQKMIARASHALVPHDEAIAPLARPAPVGYSEETPWDCQPT